MVISKFSKKHYMQHNFWNCYFKSNMYKYKMDPTKTVGATELTCDAGRTWDGRGQTDRQTDKQTDGRSETNMLPNNFVVWGV